MPHYVDVGQNSAYQYSDVRVPGPELEDMFGQFYAQLASFPADAVDSYYHYNNKNNNNNNTGKYGHFAQLVWGSTRRLGCGFVSYRRSDGKFHDVRE